jgi:hypothetical protein
VPSDFGSEDCHQQQDFNTRNRSTLKKQPLVTKTNRYMMQTIITCTWHNRHHVMLATASMDLEALQCSRYWLLPTTIWVLSVVAELVVPGGGDHPP